MGLLGLTKVLARELHVHTAKGGRYRRVGRPEVTLKRSVFGSHHMCIHDILVR